MIGIALFGAGTIGRVHARNVAAHLNCELRYIVDCTPDNLLAILPPVRLNYAQADE